MTSTVLKMTTFKCLSWLLTCTCLICFCRSQDSNVYLMQSLNQFQEDILDNKVDMIRMKKRILSFIEVTKASLRSELKENIRDEVRNAMVEILQGEALQDMVKGQVVSDLRQLDHCYHQMKREVNHVSRSFKQFKDETTIFQKSILKKADLWNQENSSDVCAREKQRLETELQKADVTTANLKTNVTFCTTLKETCQSHLSQLITNLTVPACTFTRVSVTSAPRPPVTSTPTSRPPTTSVILVAPVWSSKPHQFRQINIHSNSLGVYPYLNIKRITYVTYARKTRKLLMGLKHPDKVVTSTLDTSQGTILREGVRTYGIAVDEDRDVIFVSTLKPLYSISRMSIQGRDFTVIIDLSRYEWYPRHLTLDTKRKRMYWCNYANLFSVTYEGQGLTTLATGDQVYAVTLDQTAGVLYYNDANKLMKMTVSNNVTTQLTTLNVVPWNMRLYRNTIYYSSYDSRIVGALNLTHIPSARTLHSINMERVHSLLMCLIP